eukprot:TRINITY_DN9416_c0_g1_i1.p1 TRINITY_DN9416_c0_g1~~TRINITY_DN9416_c0_g1_i1.p1  ORF type:complete len:164 (-),score=41.37 TRINITY_DN9416_c0_g1_i1:13-435(-)
MWGFSPEIHLKRFDFNKKIGWETEFKTNILLKENSIHMWKVSVPVIGYLEVHDIPTIQYGFSRWNVSVVGYRYSLELIQSLYDVLYKGEKVTLKDIELFLEKHEEYEINSKFYYFDENDHFTVCIFIELIIIICLKCVCD